MFSVYALMCYMAIYFSSSSMCENSSFQIRFGYFILSHIRCRLVEKVILNMGLDLVLGVLMMCNEAKGTDRLVHARFIS